MRYTRFFPIFLICALCGIPLICLAQASLTQAQREELQAELIKVLAEQNQAQQDLAKAESQSNTLKNALNLLNAKIKAEQLDIQAKTLIIETLGDSISEKQNKIEVLQNTVDRAKLDMAEILRQINNIESKNFLDVMLTSKSLSNYLENGDQLVMLERDLIGLSTQTKQTEASTTAEKIDLTKKQNAAIDARYAIEQEQKTIKVNQARQQQLLSISKNNEKAYTALLAADKAKIDAINAKLFALAGGSNPIKFGQAYAYAKTAETKTGVDPAFLLAILTQESNLGNNQGRCYLSNANSGSGLNQKTDQPVAKVMNPTRDVPPFLTITNAIGVDPYQTIVSCPQSVGWGGAMGPAQFIPSTWMLLNERIKTALNISSTANPWNPEHAFMAAAMYLADLGASSSSYTAEINAACRYYSGSSCNASSYAKSYGLSVMALMSNIQQTEINPLNGI